MFGWFEGFLSICEMVVIFYTGFIEQRGILKTVADLNVEIPDIFRFYHNPAILCTNDVMNIVENVIFCSSN